MPSWKDPRLYPQSNDPLEFGLSILNEEENTQRDTPDFPRTMLVDFLNGIMNDDPHPIKLTITGDTGISLQGLCIAKTDDTWRIVKSDLRRTNADHRDVALVAALVMIPQDPRRELLRRCDSCGRFFFHSQRRRNTTGHWCSDTCKTGVVLSKRDKQRRNRYEREKRARERQAEPKGARKIRLTLGN